MSPLLEQGTLDFISHSETQTMRLGARLAKQLTTGDVLALVGEIGSGKTRWAQGVCQGLGVEAPVNSPTFTLVNEYQGQSGPVYHIDLYRLAEGADMLTFGLEEYLYGTGITLIEWADRVANLMPNDYLVIELYHLEDTKRRIIMRPHGHRATALLRAFKDEAFAQSRLA